MHAAAHLDGSGKHNLLNPELMKEVEGRSGVCTASSECVRTTAGVSGGCSL
jgi:hypothetical protein